MRDLEIRGAGNLLGDEQSGHVAAVGFELYVGMLDEAVAALAGDSADEAPEPVRMDLPVDAYVPGRLRALRGGQDRGPPPRRRRARGGRPDRAARGARGPLRPVPGAAREPDPAAGRPHQARARRAHARSTSPAAAWRSRRSSSTRRGAKALRSESPRRSTSRAARPCACGCPTSRPSASRGRRGRRGDPRGGHRAADAIRLTGLRYHSPPLPASPAGASTP